MIPHLKTRRRELSKLKNKKEFRKIIAKRLESNLHFKDYYDNYGQRLYTSLYESNVENIVLDFKEAKKLNTKFIISKYKLNSDEIEIVYGNCEKNNFCLYQIK